MSSIRKFTASTIIAAALVVPATTAAVVVVPAATTVATAAADRWHPDLEPEYTGPVAPPAASPQKSRWLLFGLVGFRSLLHSWYL